MSTKEPKAGTSLRVGGIMASIIPQDITDAYRLSKMAFQAGLLKKQKVRSYDDNGKATYDDEDDEAVMARGTMQILQGLEIGMPPMQALQLIALVGNRLVVHSEGVPAILWSKGFKLNEWQEDDYTDKWTAYCELTRPDGTVIKRSFSVKQAITAKLWSPAEKITKKGKGGSTYEAENDSAWHRFDFRMLMHRARGYAANDGGSDALRGIGVREIVEDGHMIDVTANQSSSHVLDVPDDITEDTATVTAPSTETVSEAEASQDAPFPDPQKYLNHLGEELAAAPDKAIFDEIWEAHVDGSDGRLSQAHQDEAKALYEKHGARFETKPAAKKKPKGDKDEGGALL